MAHENKVDHAESVGGEESEITIVVEQQTEKLVCVCQVDSLPMHFLVCDRGGRKCFVQRDVRGGYTVDPRAAPAHMVL